MNNSKLIFVLLAFCAIVIVVMIVLINLPRSTKPSSTMPILYPTSVPSSQQRVFPSNPPYPAFQSDTSKYQYMGDILYALPTGFLPPSKIAGYSVDSYSLTAPEATSLARTFGMNNAPAVETSREEQTLTWVNGEERVTVSLQSGSIEYTNTKVPAKSDSVTKLTRKEEVVEKAKAFLHAHGLLFSDISPSAADVSYYSDDGIEPAKIEIFEDANLFSLSLSRKLDGISVVPGFGNESQSSIWLDRFGKVTKLSFLYAAVQRGSIQQIMDSDDAKAALPKEGVVVHLGKGDQSIPSGDLVTTTFTSVSLGFFDDRTAHLFYPIYIFRGAASSKNNEVYDITVYLPALAR